MKAMSVQYENADKLKSEKDTLLSSASVGIRLNRAEQVTQWHLLQPFIYLVYCNLVVYQS